MGLGTEARGLGTGDWSGWEGAALAILFGGKMFLYDTQQKTRRDRAAPNVEPTNRTKGDRMAKTQKHSGEGERGQRKRGLELQRGLWRAGAVALAFKQWSCLPACLH